MKKKYQNKKPLILSLTAVAVVAIVSGFLGYSFGLNKHSNDTPKQNIPGYVTSESARNQVNNFYLQYLNPKKESPDTFREMLVANYGDKNLIFYKTYYQHGFDPIVCSATMPTSVVATDVRPGPGASVKAKAVYTDGTTSVIDVTLVQNTEGFKIDTITCPGDKGNLPPRS